VSNSRHGQIVPRRAKADRVDRIANGLLGLAFADRVLLLATAVEQPTDGVRSPVGRLIVAAMKVMLTLPITF
jgi:hypothetical protein